MCMVKVGKIIKEAYGEGRKALLEPEAKQVCLEYGIPVPEFGLAKTMDQALDFARQFGFPVVMKIVSPQIIHKSEAGGVRINLNSEKDVKDAYINILENAKKYNPKASIVGVLVQKMAPSGIEVIVGAIKDPQFGQTLMFGLGGVFVELLKDVTFRVAPINLQDAKEMIAELKAYPILQGYRNTPKADIETLANIILATSKLVMEHPEIKELDLNPVMVYPKGAATVDARIILE
jgi:acetate---CoA ligase (ADP-forming) subunit beta